MIRIRKAKRSDYQAAFNIRNRAIEAKCCEYYSQQQLSLWTDGPVPGGFIDDVERHFYLAEFVTASIDTSKADKMIQHLMTANTAASAGSDLDGLDVLDKPEQNALEEQDVESKYKESVTTIATGMINLQNGQVDAIFVDPDFMGQGAARLMIAHLEQLARNVGLTEIKLDSTLNAAPFYRKCGFVGETLSAYHSPKGMVLDCIPMRKRLR